MERAENSDLIAQRPRGSRSLTERVQRGRTRYAVHALLSRWQLVGLGLTGVVAAVHPQVGLFVVGPAVELALIFAVPRLRPWRRWIDQRIARERALERSAERERVLEGVSTAHRAQLERLYGLARVACNQATTPRDTSDSPARAFDALFERYVKTAYAHRECADLLTLVDEGRSASEESAASSRFREERSARREKSRAALTQLEEQLQALGALIELAYERMAAPPALEDFERCTDEFLDAIEGLDETARALSQLRGESASARWAATSGRAHHRAIG